MTMTGEITNAELARRLDDLDRHNREDMADLARRLDAFVLREVYAADRAAAEIRIAAVSAEIKALAADIKDVRDQRRAQTRWMVGSVVVPTVALIVSIIMPLIGPS